MLFWFPTDNSAGGLLEIRKHLVAKGFATSRGGKLTTQTLRRMMRSEAYCGRLVVETWGIDREDTWEPIVDRATWLKAQAVVQQKAATAVPKRRAHPDFPLRRFIHCESCGRPLTASYSRGRRGKRYGYYHCAPARPGCVRISKAKLEVAFLDELRKLRPRPELLAIWRDIVRDVWATRKAAIKNDLRIFESRVAEIKKREGTEGRRSGSPYGIRTRVTGVRGRRPGPLDERATVPRARVAYFSQASTPLQPFRGL